MTQCLALAQTAPPQVGTRDNKRNGTLNACRDVGLNAWLVEMVGAALRSVAKWGRFLGSDAASVATSIFPAK